MFRKPTAGDRKSALAADQFEHSPSFLARQHRMLFLRGPIMPYLIRPDYNGPTWIGDDIMAMNFDDPSKPIYLFIDSEGGSIQTGFTLFDIIRTSAAPVITVCTSAMSMGTVIGMAGTERWLFEHSRLMLHLPRTQIAGDTEDIKIRSKLVNDIQNQVIDIYLDRGVHALQPQKSRDLVRKQLLKDINREKWFSADEAIAYGLADKIITSAELYATVNS